jgi:Cytochrome c7 and related cytochrome c/Class III cytochrome C family
MIKVWLPIFAMAIGTIIVQTASPPVTPAPVQTVPFTPTGSGPEQPIPFNHKLHSGTLNLPCEICHELSKSGESLTIPKAPACMQCHQTLATDKPSIQKLAAFAKAGQAVPWIRVYQLPSFVRFSHKWHLDHGNTCQDCHGPVAKREQLSKEVDISMAGCMNCHRTKGASLGCDTCHTLEQSYRRALRNQEIAGGLTNSYQGNVDSFLHIPVLEVRLSQ